MRTVGAAEAVAGIGSGERVLLGSGAAVPGALVEAMTARADELRGVEVTHMLTEGPAPYVAPERSASFRHVAVFVGPNVRAAVDDGRADCLSVHLHEVPGLFASRRPLDWALVQVSPPDPHGLCSVGVSADIVMGAVRHARHVVAEVNPRMPRVLGDTMVPVERFEAVVAVDHALPELAPIESTDAVQRIGEHVAGLVDDGACLQLGIGGIPNVVARALRDHRHLGVHTEMLGDGFVDLWEAGAIDNSRKAVWPGRMVAAFVLGTQRLYDFVDDNPLVWSAGVEVVNDPFTIARNPDVVAINSALEVDLTGQVDADSLGPHPYSGFGGQVDYIRGAGASERGKPVIALPSTANGGSISRIRTALDLGAGVVTSRADVHYVVTEWGVADLFGRSLHERARALIDVAHPDFREGLEREARELRLLPREAW